MSRKGKMPIPVPKGVEVKITGETVAVKGPKGNLTQEVKPTCTVVIDSEQVLVNANGDENRKFQGLYRTLIDNMIIGVTQGFEKKLKMIGVGYRAAVQGNLIDLQVGLSHPSKLEIPTGLAVSVEKNTTITIAGSDKRLVGQFAANIRSVRPPEPYQGKGIRYVDEYVRRKAGKSAAR
ncbi:50S ribosomal protein L6 [Chlamydiales bacterium SCGC AG-110-P3]|nr:50S ribosomal protein L6 [Chlamydiales bacterium SCGC AG-110-P3]